MVSTHLSLGAKTTDGVAPASYGTANAYASEQSKICLQEHTTKAMQLPDGLNPALYRVFEKYKIDDNKLILCLWIPKKGQLNSALRSMAREQD